MIVIFHRGYLGYQPNVVSSGESYSFTDPKLENFISNGMLRIPVSDDQLDFDHLGNKSQILSPYAVSNRIYFRWLQWDPSGIFDMIIQKDFSDKSKNPQFRAIAIDDSNITSAVLAADVVDGNYLGALIHADAPFEVIDAFCFEWLVGSHKPFIWTPMIKVFDLVDKSRGTETIFPVTEIRTGPSKYIIKKETLVEKIIKPEVKSKKTPLRTVRKTSHKK